MGRMVSALRKLGFDYIFDTDYSADLTIMEEGSEFIERFQVLECHLGYAAKKLGEQIERLARERELAEARAKLQKIYSREEYERLTAGLDDDALLDKLRKYGRGIHVATPVFDGASEVEIRKLLVEAGVDEVGRRSTCRV